MTTYHYANVRGRKLFYREAGSTNLPTIGLLHGFPSSSHMFRDLIPKLEDKLHVIKVGPVRANILTTKSEPIKTLGFGRFGRRLGFRNRVEAGSWQSGSSSSLTVHE